MRIVIKILFLALTSSLCSCIDQEKIKTDQITIDLGNVKEYNLSEFVNDMKYIKLNLPEGFNLGGGVIKMMDTYIYYWDFNQKSIYIFDMSGEFIALLNKNGNGPGEYLNIALFHVDEKEKSIEIFDRESKRIITYENLTFKVLAETEIDHRVYFDLGIKIDSSRYLVSTNQYMNIYQDEKTNAEFFIYKDGILEKKLFDKKVKQANSKEHIVYSIFVTQLIKNDKDKVFASVHFDNTFYQFDNSEFQPYSEVNYVGGKSIDNDEMMKKTKKDQMLYFVNDFLKIASYPNLTINNSDITVINYMFRDKKDDPILLRHYILLKKESKEIHAKSIINDITSFPSDIKITSSKYESVYYSPWYNNYLVDVVFPSEELENDSTIYIDQIGKVNYDDHPIILLMELRK